jgi:uncharacterized membrane protein
MSIDRFLCKQADLSTILPAVAGPAIGGFAGRAIGQRYGVENLGAMLGGITGGVTGQLLKENLEQKPDLPPGAPFALDPTTNDIPAWALRGANLLKRASQLGSILGADLGGSPYTVYEGMRDKVPSRQIAKNVAGQGVGILGGGLAGHALGHALDNFVGRPLTGPLGVPVSTLLAGLGATIGNVKGLEFANK